MFISLVFTFYHSPTTLPLAFHQLLSYAYALLLMVVAISIRFCVVSPYHHCSSSWIQVFSQLQEAVVERKTSDQ